MKATVDIPDELYRQVKARSALEGRPVREVAVELFQTYVSRPEAEPVAPPASPTGRVLLADGKPAPRWFGLARKHIREGADHDMDAVRASISRGWGHELVEREVALRKASKR